jgi:hypothetical protein
MSTELVELNLAEVRAADYLNAEFLDSLNAGGHAQFALAMAYHAIDCGVTDADLREVRDAVADSNGPSFVAAAGMGDAPEAVRDTVRTAGSAWSEKCPELAELFSVAAPLLTTWRRYGAFVMHLDRIQKQVALISGLRKQA